MLNLLLAASLLTGISTSKNISETNPSFIVAGEVNNKFLIVDSYFDSVNKVGTKGHLLNGNLQFRSEFLSIGIGQSYRHTNLWSKRVSWLVAGVHTQYLEIRMRVAPESKNREAQVEARLKVSTKHLATEYRFWVEDHSQAADNYAYGLMILIGYKF